MFPINIEFNRSKYFLSLKKLQLGVVVKLKKTNTIKMLNKLRTLSKKKKKNTDLFSQYYCIPFVYLPHLWLTHI